MNNKNLEKVVVIGGSGFIGSHVADELSNSGYDVTIFDNKPSPWLRNCQKIILGDMLDPLQVSRVIKDAQYVYHFAGISDIEESKNRPVDTIYSNIMGTTNVIQAAVESRVERFVFASTMYVYSPYGSFYRASKQAAETIIETYSENFGLNYTFLRYGSLYGPRAQEWNGIRRYVSQVIKEGKLKYNGTGKERREYIHVSDAARLSIDILDDEYKNQAVTLTGLQILNSEELIDMIFEIVGTKKNVTFVKNNKNNDHYTMTPYKFTPKQSKKIVPKKFIDIGEGILEIVAEIDLLAK